MPWVTITAQHQMKELVFVKTLKLKALLPSSGAAI